MISKAGVTYCLRNYTIVVEPLLTIKVYFIISKIVDTTH